jgi:hypothetical protein
VVSRRVLLQALLTVCAGRRAAEASTAARRQPPSELSPADVQTVVAYGEAIVEGRPLSPEERAYLVQHIEESARTSAGLATLYRTTARLLDRLTGRRFVDLDFHRRQALVARHRLDARPDGSEDARSDTDAIAVRTRVLPNLIEGYWASPAGWAAVGYTTFPGRCGDLDRYTRGTP